MNYGMYVSASGVLVNSHRLDVLSNNLANINTPGFKPQIADVQSRDPEMIEDGTLDPELSRRMLEQLGGGVFAANHRTSFAVGALIDSGKELDVALTGSDTFFAVQAEDEQTGRSEVHLTRNGRFRNADGLIVSSAGHPVLDDGDSPIKIPAGTVNVDISSRGDVMFLDSHGNELGSATLQVVTADTASLEYRGKGLFDMTLGNTRKRADTPDVRQFHYEASGTSPIQTMMEIVAATKAATGNANMIRYHDQMMNQAINTFARLS